MILIYILLATLQVRHVWQLTRLSGIGKVPLDRYFVLRIFADSLSLILFFNISQGLFFWHPWVAAIGLFLFVGGYGVLCAYHLKAKVPIDWSLTHQNIGRAFSPGSGAVVGKAFDSHTLWWMLSALAVCGCLVAYTSPLVSVSPEFILVSSIVYGVFVCLHRNSSDPFLYFFNSIYTDIWGHSWAQKNLSGNNTSFLNNTHKTLSYREPQPTPLPHIFLILSESLKAHALDKTTPDGRAYTPFLNQLKQESLFVEWFYSNSIRTSKVHFSTLFSFFPSLKGRIFTDHQDLNIESIGTTLKQAGYRSYFIQAQSEDHDDTAGFLTQRGFDSFETIPAFLTPEELATKSCWGVDDTLFYRGVLRSVDTKLRENDGPCLFVLAPIANHFPYSILPENKRRLYPEPLTPWEEYANSVYWSDQGLQSFFSALNTHPTLKQSLVVLTGDHGVPLGEHGTTGLEIGYYDESYRVPLFVTWPGHVQPHIIRHQAHSQLDILPTILDLIGLRPGPNHFQGHSILNSPATKPILMVQPYGGGIVAILRYPIKYIWHVRSNKTEAYALDIDPAETQNIVTTLSPNIIAQFKSDLDYFLQADAAIRNNALFTP